MKWTHIIWTSKTEYYDTENGEQITKSNFKQNYVKIKTNKHVKVSQHEPRGAITYTIECKKQPQLKLQY